MLDTRRAGRVGFRPMTIQDLIHHAGGKAKLALVLGCKPHSVHMWCHQGIPYKHHAKLRDMLRRRVGSATLQEALVWRPARKGGSA